MNENKNIGLIVCGRSGLTFRMHARGSVNDYSIKKVMIDGVASEHFIKTYYPEAEIVSDTSSILKDASLDLIVIDAPFNNYPDMITEVIQSGIPVRIV